MLVISCLIFASSIGSISSLLRFSTSSNTFFTVRGSIPAVIAEIFFINSSLSCSLIFFIMPSFTTGMSLNTAFTLLSSIWFIILEERLVMLPNNVCPCVRLAFSFSFFMISLLWFTVFSLLISFCLAKKLIRG